MGNSGVGDAVDQRHPADESAGYIYEVRLRGLSGPRKTPVVLHNLARRGRHAVPGPEPAQAGGIE